MTSFRNTPRYEYRRAPARTAWVGVLGIVGLLCYLLLPALHAVHAPPCAAPASGEARSHACHHHHDHATDERPSDDRPGDDGGAPWHDSGACGVCQVFFATQSGTDVPIAPTGWTPALSVVSSVLVRLDEPTASPTLPACPARGPPATA